MVGLAAMAIAYVLSQFFRSFLAVLTPALTAELGASKADLSLASGAWFVAFALAQFLIGTGLDRYGPRRTVAAMLAVGGGGGALVFAAAVSPWMVAAGMALIGFGCAPVLMAAIFIFARTFPPARLAVLSSWFIAIGSIGNVAGTSPFAALADAVGWREVVAGIALLSLLTAAAVLALVDDPPQGEAHPDDAGGFAGYLQVVRIARLWPMVLIIGMHYAPLIGILGLWAGPYLSDVHGADSLAIGHVTLFMALAAIAGSFLYGPLDTLFGTRKWVAVAGNTGSILVLSWLAFFPARGTGSATVAFVLIGVFGSGFALIMAHARAFMPGHLTGRGITLLNFCSIGAVGLMQFLSGLVVTSATVPGRPEAAYSALFAFYAAALGLAVASYLFSTDAPPEHGPHGMNVPGSAPAAAGDPATCGDD